MKKLVLALATVAAFGAAQAQSGVTVYGVIDASYHSSETSAQKSNGAITTTKSSGITNSTLSASRLGVKGTENLGSGLTANFVTEWSINATSDGAFTKYDGAAQPVGNKTTDGAAMAPFNRQTWVGLASPTAGEVRVGYQNNIQYNHNLAYTAGYEGAAGARNHLDVLAANGFGGTVANTEGGRFAGFTYITPTVGGLTGSAQWGKTKLDQVSGTQAATTVNTEMTHRALGVEYVNGALRAGAATARAEAQSATGALMTTNNQWQGRGTVYGTSYDFGAVKVFGYYGNRHGEQAGLKDVDIKTKRIGAQVPMGKFTPFATVNTVVVDESGTRVGDRKGVQYGTTYGFSKRTTGFVIYGKDTDDHSLAGASAGTVAAWGIAAAAGTPTDYRTIHVGLNHSF